VAHASAISARTTHQSVSTTAAWKVTILGQWRFSESSPKVVGRVRSLPVSTAAPLQPPRCSSLHSNATCSWFSLNSSSVEPRHCGASNASNLNATGAHGICQTLAGNRRQDRKRATHAVPAQPDLIIAAQDFRLRTMAGDAIRKHPKASASLQSYAGNRGHTPFNAGTIIKIRQCRTVPRMPRRWQLSGVELTLQRHVAYDVVYEFLSRKLPPALSFDECV